MFNFFSNRLCLSDTETYRFELNLSSNVSSSVSSSEKPPFCGAEKRSFRVTPSSLKYCSAHTNKTQETSYYSDILCVCFAAGGT